MSLHPLNTQARITILVVAFLGWFFGGIQIGLTNLGGPATIGLLQESGWTTGLSEKVVEQQIKTWAAYLQVAFLFGAAAGGFLFGRLGDSIGRTRALGISIIWFSVFTALSYFASNPLHLIIMRFIACLGVGGCWPNGVALVGESWSEVKRPVMASMIGMAGNVGIFALATLLKYYPATSESFRWVFLVGASALPVGVLILFFVRESPAWLNAREKGKEADGNKIPPKLSVFRKPYLGVTLVGIALATVPLFGGWGSFLWIVFWAGRIGDELGLPELKAEIVQVRSLLSTVGCALAAFISVRIGRRTCYFLSSFAALFISQYIFWFTIPTDRGFLVWVAFLGFFNGIFFGWLPFFLPELFETKVRATGAGVSFNYGRILTAITISLTPTLTFYFDGDYAQIGRVTSLIFILGMVAILLAPNTSKRNMEE